MKRLFFLVTLAALLAVACNKEESGSVEGKWYAYTNGGNNVSLYLELKGGNADLIISAWGTRYKGPYTYENGNLTINYSAFQTRYIGEEEPEKATATNNLLKDWPGPSSADHIILDKPIRMEFKVTGDKADCNFETIGARLEMERKK